jgi:hypothetical protein
MTLGYVPDSSQGVRKQRQPIQVPRLQSVNSPTVQFATLSVGHGVKTVTFHSIAPIEPLVYFRRGYGTWLPAISR